MSAPLSWGAFTQTNGMKVLINLHEVVEIVESKRAGITVRYRNGTSRVVAESAADVQGWIEGMLD